MRAADTMMRTQTPKYVRLHASVPYSTSGYCSHCLQCTWASVFNCCVWFTLAQLFSNAKVQYRAYYKVLENASGVLESPGFFL